jgi:hypothetical protein
MTTTNTSGVTLTNNSAFGSNTTATAESTHEMLRTFIILLIFVIVATTVAGISDTMADGMLALMAVFLVLQAVTHGAALADFSERFAIQPKNGS